MSDDGAGPAALSLLRRQLLPHAVSLHNLESSSINTLELLKADGPLILLDALRGGSRVGTVYRLPAFRLGLDSLHSFSLHELHLLHLAARFFPRRLRQISVLGVEPAYIGPGTVLSREVTLVLPLLVLLANREVYRLSKLG